MTIVAARRGRLWLYGASLEEGGRAGRAAEKESPPLIPILDGDKIVPGAPPIERFLKRVRERNTQGPIRFGLPAGWRAITSRMQAVELRIDERARLTQELCQDRSGTSGISAQSRSFPGNVAGNWVIPVLRDIFAGKDVQYRREGKEFVLWSVGPNGKDGGGDRDDLVIRSRAPEKGLTNRLHLGCAFHSGAEIPTLPDFLT